MATQSFNSVDIRYDATINGNKSHRLGLFATKVGAVIESGMERNAASRQMVDKLFNELTADSSHESHIIESGLGNMRPVPAGYTSEESKTDYVGEKTYSFIPHQLKVRYTHEYLEDSKYRLKEDGGIKAETIPNAYFRTKNAYAQKAYILGENQTADIKYQTYKDKYGDTPNSPVSETLDLTTWDGLALFNTAHSYDGHKTSSAYDHTQSNLFKVVLPSGNAFTAGDVAEWLAQMAIYLRQMKDANGEALGYTADQIFIPGSAGTFKVQDMVRRAIGSDFFPGGANNDINPQAGQFDLIPLIDWAPTLGNATAGGLVGEIIMCSSACRREKLCANFFDREKLRVDAYTNSDTYDLYFNSYARFGLGFTNYVHTAKLKIYYNGTSSTVGTAL